LTAYDELATAIRAATNFALYPTPGLYLEPTPYTVLTLTLGEPTPIENLPFHIVEVLEDGTRRRYESDFLGNERDAEEFGYAGALPLAVQTARLVAEKLENALLGVAQGFGTMLRSYPGTPVPDDYAGAVAILKYLEEEVGAKAFARICAKGESACLSRLEQASFAHGYLLGRMDAGMASASPRSIPLPQLSKNEVRGR
jgi:hypothetical protein